MYFIECLCNRHSHTTQTVSFGALSILLTFAELEEGDKEGLEAFLSSFEALIIPKIPQRQSSLSITIPKDISEHCLSSDSTLCNPTSLRTSDSLRTNSISSDDFFMQSLPLIVTKMTASVDLEMTKAILLYISKFGKIQELLTLLLEKFSIVSETSDPLQLRVINILCLWISLYPIDLASQQSHLIDLKNKLFSHWGNSLLVTKLEKSIQQLKHSTIELLDSSFMSLPTSDSGMNLIALSENDLEMLADQFCLIDQEFFMKLQPRGFLTRDEPILNHIAFFNHVSYWVIDRILEQSLVKNRIKSLEKLMKLSLLLAKRYNYNCLMACISGLSNASIRRLDSTWNGVSKRLCKSYLPLEELMSSDRSYANYRQALKSVALPCIPFLGVFLRDLIYIEQPKGNLIHVGKLLASSEIIFTLMSYQSISYDFTPHRTLQEYILSSPMTEQVYKLFIIGTISNFYRIGKLFQRDITYCFFFLAVLII